MRLARDRGRHKIGPPRNLVKPTPDLRLGEKGLGDTAPLCLVARIPRLHLVQTEGSGHEGSDAASIVRVDDSEPREPVAMEARDAVKMHIEAALDIGDVAPRTVRGSTVWIARSGEKAGS